MDQPTPEQSKQGKARERQQRRRARREAMAKPLATARKAHLSPSGGWKMPEIDPRYVRPVLLTATALLFMVVIILVIGVFEKEPPPPPPNAIWLGADWTYQSRSEDDLRRLIDRLRDHQIGAVYAYVGELGVDGTWTGPPEQPIRFSEARSQIQAFVEQFRRSADDIQLYGALIVRIDLGEADGYRLDDPTLQSAVTEFSAQVVNSLDFDGILLQVDPFVSNGDENFVSLAQQVRQAIGDSALLALVIPPDWTPIDVAIPMPASIAPGTAWDGRYKQRVALLLVDQLVLRAYDSYMSAEGDYTANDYAAWVAYQVRAYTQVLAEVQSDTRLMIAVFTGDNSPPAHDVRVENITSEMAGVRNGLREAGDAAAMLQGIAIYAEWMTDAVEWTQLSDNQLNR